MFLKYILRVKAWIFLNETQILVFVESAIFHSILGKKYDTRYVFWFVKSCKILGLLKNWILGLNPTRCLTGLRDPTL